MEDLPYPAFLKQTRIQDSLTSVQDLYRSKMLEGWQSDTGGNDFTFDFRHSHVFDWPNERMLRLLTVHDQLIHA
jgi:hypothetical protein